MPSQALITYSCRSTGADRNLEARGLACNKGCATCVDNVEDRVMPFFAHDVAEHADMRNTTGRSCNLHASV